jgi:hypothetical protein
MGSMRAGRAVLESPCYREATKVSFGGSRSLFRGDSCKMQFHYIQDRLCMVKSHILRDVTLLHRTQLI